MRRSLRFFAISLPLLLILSGAALADKCESFGSYQCAKGSHDGMQFGPGSSNGSYILLGSNMFTVHSANGEAGADVIIIAAFSGSVAGSLNGNAFSSLSVSTFPEKGASGAITGNLQSLGFCTSCSLQYGIVDLKTALAAGGSINITASGVPAGTVFYAELLNSKGEIIQITANSEAGILGRTTSVVPEPGSLSLMITGLCGIAGGAWRKLRG
jgi:hypothetical protein